MFDFSKMKSKKVKPGSVEEEATRSVLEGISKKAGDKMADGLKKVSVAAPDKAGLEKGLDVAKKVVGDEGLDADVGGEELGEMEEPSGEAVQEVVDQMTSLDEVEKAIQLLEMKKAELANK